MPTRASPTAHRGQVWLGLLVLYFVWGSTYLGIAYAVETIPPFLMAAIRFALAGLVLFVFTLVPLLLRALFALLGGDIATVRRLAGARSIEEDAADEIAHTGPLQGKV